MTSIVMNLSPVSDFDRGWPRVPKNKCMSTLVAPNEKHRNYIYMKKRSQFCAVPHMMNVKLGLSRPTYLLCSTDASNNRDALHRQWTRAKITYIRARNHNKPCQNAQVTVTTIKVKRPFRHVPNLFTYWRCYMSHEWPIYNIVMITVIWRVIHSTRESLTHHHPVHWKQVICQKARSMSHTIEVNIMAIFKTTRVKTKEACGQTMQCIAQPKF